MTPELRGFIQRLIHQSINAGIHSIFWRLPTLLILLIVGGLIWAVVHFQLY